MSYCAQLHQDKFDQEKLMASNTRLSLEQKWKNTFSTKGKTPKQ